ncbi:MAG: iron-sulfur cluster assembly accessory protein [Pleurocapsa sp.]
MVQISQAAAREINRIKLSRQQPDSFLRLEIKSGGCSGLFYDLGLASNPTQGDRCYESSGIFIVVDSDSQPYIENLQLDYSEDLMGGGFRFRNPQAANVCGCGLSFSQPQAT